MWRGDSMTPDPLRAAVITAAITAARQYRCGPPSPPPTPKRNPPCPSNTQPS